MSKGKLLITGGTGSFGNKYLDQALAENSFSEIVIFSRDEKKQNDQRKLINDKRVTFFIGDIRDYESVSNAMTGVDYVFHAAALKQVPSCEFFPIEAVKINVLGTNNILRAAELNQVKKVIVLSTDKAAYPINAMGLTKALMEKVMVAKSRSIANSKTVLCGTRFGNVMASRGSVIPLFISQIKSKQDITITNPNMTRFMMSLNMAVKLVDYAFENAGQGDIFVQKSPAATLKTLADALIEIFESKSKVREIGIRHGEKMHETLLTSEEMFKSQDLGDYFRIPSDTRDLNYSLYFSKGSTDVITDEYNSFNTELLGVEELKKLLLSIPEVFNEL
ncbi:MAG: polysaccharide biosynthesis protein [Bacteroidota bacterium]|nr:polysaccharide biosynthesis protein [Bacteroidota bacterium]